MLCARPSVVSLNKITSVSETIRKPPLVIAQTAFKKNKINKIWRKTIYNMADGIITLCDVARS